MTIWEKAYKLKRKAEYYRNKHVIRQRFVVLIIIFVITLFVACSLASCKTLPSAAPIPSAHNRDSVRIEYVHDSITVDRWHTEFQKGDTVYIHDSIFRDRWHDRHDTITTNTTDTIYQPVPYEKKGSAFLQNSGIALWVLLGVLFLAVVLGIILKFAK